MIKLLPSWLLYTAGFVFAALVSMYAVRKILFITQSHKIFDVPDDTRKIHGANIPSLGGLAIYAGFMLTGSFFWPSFHLQLNYFLVSSFLLVFTGVYDDLMNMRPWKKLAVQLLASGITIYLVDIRITSLYGLAGIETLPTGISYCLTIIACTLFINAFNFIDGIDGLACMLAILYACLTGVLYSPHHEALALICFVLAGATFGLLAYNFSPAKIYMGDTGSMLLGFTLFILTLLFLKLNIQDEAFYNTPPGKAASPLLHSAAGAFMIFVSILFLPVFDAIRVFIVRISMGRSPLRADRNHLHYYLLDAGFSHSWATFVILGINILLIGATFLLQDTHPLFNLFCMIVIASAALAFIYVLRRRNLPKGTNMRDRMVAGT